MEGRTWARITQCKEGPYKLYGLRGDCGEEKRGPRLAGDLGEREGVLSFKLFVAKGAVNFAKLGGNSRSGLGGAGTQKVGEDPALTWRERSKEIVLGSTFAGEKACIG